MKFTLIIFALIIALPSFSQDKSEKEKQPKTQTIEITVSGVCGMCEDRIEGALDIKEVKSAEWDLDSKKCKIVFKPKKITEDEIHQLIADVGHDTNKVKATDKAYNNVHSCCKYRDKNSTNCN